MKDIYLIYSPLVLTVLIVVCGVMIYYCHKYEIGDASTMNKYRLSKQNILIKLNLFKYNNKFNYFLLIPYLIAWNLFFVVFIFYIIYWCGIKKLAIFLGAKVVIIPLLVLLFLYMLYSGCIQQHILDSNRLENPDFKIGDKKETKD